MDEKVVGFFLHWVDNALSNFTSTEMDALGIMRISTSGMQNEERECYFMIYLHILTTNYSSEFQYKYYILKTLKTG